MNPDLAYMIALLPVGHENAVSASQLAREVAVSRREVGKLVEQAIVEEGYCIGSLCGKHPGYFLIRPDDPRDLELGVGHTVQRAAASFRRVRALRRNYEAMPAHGQTAMFDGGST